MAFNPVRSALFGGESLMVTFDESNILGKTTQYYVIFEGQHERHVTTAVLSSPNSLRAVIPEHRMPEVLNVALVCQLPTSLERSTLASSTFAFVEDSAHEIASHLVNSVDDRDALQPTGAPLKWRDFDLSEENLTTLDNRLLKVFLEMKLPRDWNLLGEDYNLQDIPARESLMHFTARLGLLQLTEFFLYQPGCLDALGLPNKEGLVPMDIAQQLQNLQLINILKGKNYYSTGGPPWLEKWKKPRPSTMVQRHEGGMATITNEIAHSKRTLDDDLKLLHNMSKVIYNDKPILPPKQLVRHPVSGYQQHPASQDGQHSTRQRHSMVEDYHRQKLYYPDKHKVDQHQRHSLAEQMQHGSRLFDISLESNPLQQSSSGHRLTQQIQSQTTQQGQGYSFSQGQPSNVSLPQPMVTPTSRMVQKPTINKPRYPSPPSRSSESDDGHAITRHQKPEPQQYPASLSPHSVSGESLSTTQVQYSSQSASSTTSISSVTVSRKTSPLERVRERRPLSNQDGIDLEKELWDKHQQSQRARTSEEDTSLKYDSGEKRISPESSRENYGEKTVNQHSKQWTGSYPVASARKPRILPDVPAWDAGDGDLQSSYQEELRKTAQEVSKTYSNNPLRTRHSSGQEVGPPRGAKLERDIKRQTSWNLVQNDRRQSDESSFREPSASASENRPIDAVSGMISQQTFYSQNTPKDQMPKYNNNRGMDYDHQHQTSSLDRRHRTSQSQHFGVSGNVLGNSSKAYNTNAAIQPGQQEAVGSVKPRPRSAGHVTGRTPADSTNSNHQDSKLLSSATCMKSPTPLRQPAKLPIHHGRSSSMEGMIGPDPVIEPILTRGRFKSTDDNHLCSKGLMPLDIEEEQSTENATAATTEVVNYTTPGQKPLKIDIKENEDPSSIQSYDSSGQYRYKKYTSQLMGEHQKKYYQKSSDKWSIGTTPSPKDSIMKAFLEGLPGPGEYVEVFQSPDGTFVPALHSEDTASSLQGVVLEDNLRRLQEIQDGIHKLRELNANDKKENSRRDSLQRHSTSCPSLADKLLQTARNDPIENTEHHKSMQDLKREASQSPVPDNEDAQKVEPDIQIYINDVTIGTSTDYTAEAGSPQEDSELLLIEEMKKNQRRSSWCPEEERKKEDKSEKQRLLLGVCGRSQSLSSLEGEDDESDEESVSSFQQRTVKDPTLSVSEHIDYMDMDDEEDEDEDDMEKEDPIEVLQSAHIRHKPPAKPEILISSPEGRTEATTLPPGEQLRNHRYREGSIGSVTMSPGCSIPSPSHTSTVEGEVLEVSGNLPKAASTPSICSNQDIAEADKKRSGSISGSTAEVSPNITKRSRLSSDEMGIDGASLQEENVEETENNDTQTPKFSMMEFLNDFSPKNSVENDHLKREDNKDDRKRSKPSMFSKLGSYRQKKVVKDNKAVPSTHQFVSVSFSNSTSCDVCGKSMANKSALQCENCLVNVHENSCKDQISRCARSRGSTKVGRFQSTSLPAGHQIVRPAPSNLKASQSFKEPSRILTPPQSNLHTSQSAVLNNRSSATPNSSKVEEQDDMTSSQLLAETSNITDVLSVSMESIEEEHTELEIDPDLYITVNEPEAWSVTVDKRTLKKMSAKDIKRQDHIWEFIQTEKSHCRTLKIMHKIFYNGLLKECDLSQEMVDRIFPRLFELLDIHLLFLNKLLKRQAQTQDRSLEVIGDLLYEQFSGVLGDQMKEAYGDFCSRHHEAVQLYKDIHKENKKVQVFAKKCSNNVHCKRLDIPACILLVTQRTSKYPLLMESIIKATKEFKEEKENLKLSLSAVRDILAVVDRRIDEHEKYQKLIEIYNRVDARSYANFKGSKFKKSGLLSNGRKLLHEGYIKWMSARGKPCEVLAVILSDVMFFLAESNGKLSFFTQDNKSSVISLSKLLVREKGDTKDSKGIYLICQSKTEPEMYELVCKSADERKFWIQVIKEATARCFEEEAGALRSEEDRKLLEAKSARLRQLIDQLRQRDQCIRAQCEEKMKVYGDMVELFGKEDAPEKVQLPYKDEEGQEWPDPDTLLQAAIQQGEKLMALLQSSAASVGSNGSSINLSRSVSSVGEHSTGNTTPPLPKRAETFSGFENKEGGRASVKKRFPTVHAGSKPDTTAVVTSNQLEAADSGLGLESASKSLLQRRISVGVPYAIQEANNRIAVKEKANPRRMSTSFLQNLLTKQHNDRDDVESNKSSDKSSDRGSTLDLSALSPAPSVTNLALSKEQCQSVTQLMQYVHGLACMASRQHSELESLKAQLGEATAKNTQLYSENDHFTGHPEKKSKYHHDKQLEELRNLQEHINQDRTQFEKIRTQQNLEIHQEKLDIKKEREDLERQRSELKGHRDELQRQKEVLQRQMDLFEEQKSLFQKAVAATELAQQATNKTSGGLGQRERSESPIIEHRRTASSDLSQRHSRESSPFDGGSLKEPLNKVKNRSNSGGVGLATGPSKSTLPYHLMSGSSEQKVTQKLPLKLASGKPTTGSNSSTSGSSSGAGSGSSGKAQVKQVLPFKLSGGQPGSGHPSSNSSSSSISYSAQQVTSGSSNYSNTTTSTTSCSPAGPSKQPLQHTRSQPSLSLLKKTPLNAHNSASNILPMKLAEKSTSSQSQQQRPKSLSSLSKTNNNLSMLSSDSKQNNAKGDDKKVIYF